MHCVIGRLMYLTISIPDIAYLVNRLGQFMSKPQTSHLQVVQHLVRYIKGNPGQDIFFSAKSNLSFCLSWCRLRELFSNPQVNNWQRLESKNFSYPTQKRTITTKQWTSRSLRVKTFTLMRFTAITKNWNHHWCLTFKLLKLQPFSLMPSTWFLDGFKYCFITEAS